MAIRPGRNAGYRNRQKRRGGALPGCQCKVAEKRAQPREAAERRRKCRGQKKRCPAARRFEKRRAAGNRPGCRWHANFQHKWSTWRCRWGRSDRDLPEGVDFRPGQPDRRCKSNSRVVPAGLPLTAAVRGGGSDLGGCVRVRRGGVGPSPIVRSRRPACRRG